MHEGSKSDRSKESRNAKIDCLPQNDPAGASGTEKKSAAKPTKRKAADLVAMKLQKASFTEKDVTVFGLKTGYKARQLK